MIDSRVPIYLSSLGENIVAYDGIVISSIIHEIREACEGGRVMKIQQPSSDVITLTIKGFKGQTKIYISASASLPIVYIADQLPQAPMQAPAFCMLLRKHLGNGRFVGVTQPGFDRIFDFAFEHMDEMGDIGTKHLIIEIMGRQSNIILTDSDMKIIDLVKRVMPDLSEAISSDDDKKVRILYPGQEYTPPDGGGKIDIVSGFDRNLFADCMAQKNVPVPKAIFTSFTGFSKGIAEEITYRAGIDGRMNYSDLTDEQKESLADVFESVINDIKENKFQPCILYVDEKPKDYHAMHLSGSEAWVDDETGDVAGMSSLLREFYNKKEKTITIKSSATDIKKLVSTLLERASKKYDLQLGQMRDSEDREIYKVYGELINTYGYNLKGGENELTCINYNDNQEITIPLDPNLSAQENSQKYFAKYNKKKRTHAALTDLLKTTKEDMDYLLSVKHNLEMAETVSDVEEIRAELEKAGIVRARGSKKGARKTKAGEPMHFVSSDGYDIYVGRNNIQNDELTFGFAEGKDVWFHAKQMPGSHVIVKLKANDKSFRDLPDRVFEEAASLAAYYSSGKDAPKVEIDYTERKQLKKPPQAKPGYVIYHTNYSMMAEPKADGVKQA